MTLRVRALLFLMCALVAAIGVPDTASALQLTPSVPVAIEPANGATVSTTRPTLVWSEDLYTLTYEVYLDGDPDPVDTTLLSTWRPPNALAQGVHTWKINAKNLLGQEFSTTSTFTVETFIDTPAFITSPTEGAVFTIDRPTFTWSAAVNPGTMIDHYRLLIDGQSRGTALASSTTMQPDQPLASGVHSAVIVAIDVLANERTSDPVTFTVQLPSTTPPADTGTGGATPPATKPPVLPVKLTGGAKPDKLFGNALANLINGMGGNDMLHGGAGNDKVVGGVGHDKLFGDAGNDVLDGHDHTKGDLIDGGAGKDTCIYNTGDVVKNCEKKILKK